MASTLLGNTSTNTNTSTTDQTTSAATTTNPNQTTSATNFDATDANQQLAASLNNNGLLMRMAKQSGLQTAGQRGLMNSSIGAGAAQKAMVDAAQTTAQQNTQAAQSLANSKELAAQQQEYTLTNTAKQVAANTQGMYLDAINGLTSTFGDQVAAIQASALTATEKKTAINSLISSQNAMLKFYQQTYQNMSTINDDWINVDVETLPTGSISEI